MSHRRATPKPSVLGESGWVSRVARASQIRTTPLGRRVRHFGARHRISCYRIRWPEAPPRAWAPRRARRSLGIVSEALGAGFVPIRARSCAVPAGLLLGVVPSQRLAERLERASLAPSVGCGEGFASPRLGSQRLKGRLSAVFCLERHSAFHARFITPCKDTNSTRSRAAAPASGARRVVRAPVGDAAAPSR